MSHFSVGFEKDQSEGDKRKLPTHFPFWKAIRSELRGCVIIDGAEIEVGAVGLCVDLAFPPYKSFSLRYLVHTRSTSLSIQLR